MFLFYFDVVEMGTVCPRGSQVPNDSVGSVSNDSVGTSCVPRALHVKDSDS